MTKAELEKKIEELELEKSQLEDQLVTSGAILSGTIEKQTGLSMWVANRNTSKECLCIGSGNHTDSPFSLEVYFADDGAMMGAVFGDSDGEIIGIAGHIPAEVVYDEIRFARGERIAI